MAQFMGPDTMLGKALGGVNGLFLSEDGVCNRPEVRAAEIPAANGVTNARSLARMYAGLVGTVDDGPAEPLLDEETVERATELQTHGADQVPHARDHLRPRVLRRLPHGPLRRRPARSATPAPAAPWASPTRPTASPSATS